MGVAIVWFNGTSTRRIGNERGRAGRLIRARAPPPELAPAPPWAVGDELPKGPRRQRFTCNELGGQYPLPLCGFILRRPRPLIARGPTQTEGNLLGTARQSSPRGCPSSLTRQSLYPHLPKLLRARGPSRPRTCCFAPGARAGPGDRLRRSLLTEAPQVDHCYPQLRCPPVDDTSDPA